jgi:general secretion pathway protein K
MRRPDERGIALLLTLLVLTLLVALILEFDVEARREYRDAAAFRDNFKVTVLARAAVQAARGILQQDFVKDKLTGQFFDAPTDVWALPLTKYAIGDGLLTAQIEDERGKLNLNDLGTGGNPRQNPQGSEGQATLRTLTDQSGSRGCDRRLGRSG